MVAVLVPGGGGHLGGTKFGVTGKQPQNVQVIVKEISCTEVVLHLTVSEGIIAQSDPTIRRRGTSFHIGMHVHLIMDLVTFMDLVIFIHLLPLPLLSSILPVSTFTHLHF